MKIAILKGSSTNNVLDTFSHQLARGVDGIGHESAVLDVARDDVLADLINTLRDHSFDAVVSFNGILGDVVGPDQRNLMEHAGIPFIAWLVDHPAHHYHRLAAPNEFRWTLCTSKDHVAFLDAAGVSGLWQHLHAAADPWETTPKASNERRMPVLLAATWMREPEKFWEHIQSDTTRAIIENVIERVMDDGSVSVTTAFGDVLASKGLPFQVDASVARVLVAILMYVRRHDRLNLVHCLARSGLPVTLYGKGWKENLAGHGRLSFVDDVPSAELSRRYGDARIVLNINAANGASERAFAAMQAGACVLSDQNDVLATIAEPGTDLMFFDRRQPEGLAQALGDLLESDRAGAIAHSGMIKARTHHTWESRASQLVQWIAETSMQAELPMEAA